MAGKPSRLEDDVSARADALHPGRSFIVQAPAGSGKTELLIQRYLCLLSTVDRPEEVMAITFTRKAAQEMKNRVIDSLRAAVEGRIAETAHEKLTLSLAGAAIARSEDKGWQLTASPARLRIETVDAFSSGIARSIPVSSGLGGTARTVTDTEIAGIYAAAASATLDHLAVGGPAGDAVSRVLGHLDNNVGLYQAHLARMLAKREQWLAITGIGGLRGSAADRVRAGLEQNIEDVITRQLKLLDELLPPVCRNELPALLEFAGRNLCDAGNTAHRLVSFADGAGLPEPVASARHAWHAIADLLLTKTGEWRRQATKNDGFPANRKAEKRALADLIGSLHGLHDFREQLHLARALPDPHYTDSQWEVLQALFDLLPLAVSELKRLFSERGVTDHSEVALAAGRALGSADEPTDLALILDYRIRHLLVDELQDTSIAQYELLKKLSAGWSPGDGRTIFCVGDPMQSIYRFRDAEVGEFLLSKQRGIGSVPLESLTLRRNFRSGEHLVDWFNTVFNQVMPLRDDVATGAISYADSVPVESRTGSGEYRVHALFGATEEEEAGVTLDVIRQCLEAGDGDEVAVLVRSRMHLRALLKLLREAGLGYESVEIDRLTDLPEIGDLLALTRALCHGGDRLAWLAMLRGPYAGLKWDDIHSLVMNDRDSTVPALMQDAERLDRLSPDGRTRLVRLRDRLQPFSVADHVEDLAGRVERAWYAIGGPAPLDAAQIENVCRYLSTLARLQAGGTLDDITELERRLDDERVSGREGQCRLRVMTMHKAKGLEFGHVILPSLGRVTRGGAKAVLRWLNVPDASGASEMILSPVGPRAELENDPLHQFIEATENEKDRLELDRLLYVACTRAMKSLHLVGSVGVLPDRSDCRAPDPRSLLSRLWPAVEREYRSAFERWNGAADPPLQDDRRVEDAPLEVPVLRRLQGPWSPPALLTLPQVRRSLPDPEESSADRVEFDWVGATARHAGTIVHRWLERLGTADSLPPVDSLDRLGPATRRWAQELGVPADEVGAVCDRVLASLRGILEDDRGRWILSGDGACELPLTGVHDSSMRSVVIDRVRIDDDGVHWIIDYKTSTHEGGDLASFLAQESTRYREQLARYAALYANLAGEKARTALYFPLLREFVEVPSTAAAD